jgi:hypothetical protein
MNPKKCAFGISAGLFLGFLVHERGIEIGLKSQEAVKTMVPPTTKKELQQLIGKINFVRRFISNLSRQIEPFMELVKIKASDEFRWGAEQQRAFEEIKKYLSKPPVLVPPQQDMPFYVYLSVGDTSIALVVIQVHDGKERVVFYLSRRMLDAETRYPEIEKLCLLYLYKASSYLAICQNDCHLQIGCYQAHAIGSCVERPTRKVDVCTVRVRYPVPTREGSQRASTGRSYCRKDQYQHSSALRACMGHVLRRIGLWGRMWYRYPAHVASGATYSFSIRLPTLCTNNLAEYEAVHKGMELLLEAGAEVVEIFGDSKLVISQLTEE